mmetsp:Transcript_31821/g.102804  ORF Transcript_31821/g.102804 Transcript_31821/m.102804 type:complete len:258 (-) Transcript_31821:52-825(-)|eukprot:scaffold19909_cov130-Isochrysis_galbana.AAC.6
MSLPSEDLGRLHRTLQDAVSAEADVAAEIERLDSQLKLAHAQAKAKRAELLSLLDNLTRRPVTVAALEKTLVGVTVNGLRKHESPAVAAKSEILVRSWKALVESGKTWGSLAGSSAASAKPSGPSFSRGLGPRTAVLDEVRDEDGRVERRRAHPDSHEDQLALSEAAEAERMWEEAMGGGGGRAGRDEEAARKASAEKLRERYRHIEETKRGREIEFLNKLPKASKGAHGRTPSRPASVAANPVLSRLKGQANKLRR